MTYNKTGIALLLSGLKQSRPGRLLGSAIPTRPVHVRCIIVEYNNYNCRIIHNKHKIKR